MNLTRTAINRPVFVLMAMLAIFMMGFIAYKSMRIENNPDVSFGVATVTTVYPGAGPDEVNTLVSKKIEDAVSGIANLQEVVSTSQEGVSSVVLQFEIGTDMNVALNDVRTKVDAAVGGLPKEALKPIVDKLDTTSSPVLSLAMTSDKMSSRELRDVLDNKIKDRFARIKGVALVGINGGDEREIQVQVKKDALLRYGIGVVDLQRAIQGATVNVPSGRIVEGAQEYTVRLLGEFKSVSDIENMYLSFAGEQRGDATRRVRLGDLATVKDTIKEVRSRSRMNGKDAVVVVVQKTKQGNAIEIANAIREPNFPDPAHPGKKINLLQQIEHDYGIQSEVTQDTSVQIRESIEDLNFTLFFGIFLVAMVVFVFLHDVRGTLIVAIAIPVCIFATFIAMQALGFTINNLSMLALSLAVGVLVDDAIVVLENIYRHLRMGEAPAAAALAGRSEIGLAAIAITLADVVVFLPIGNMGGVVGQFFRPLGIGYAVCVMFSLAVSFTVTPMLAARWYRAGEDLEHPKAGWARAFEHAFESLADRYRALLRVSLRHRWYMFGGGFAALFALFMFIGGSFTKDIPSAIAVGARISVGVVVIGILTFIGNGFKDEFTSAIETFASSRFARASFRLGQVLTKVFGPIVFLGVAFALPAPIQRVTIPAIGVGVIALCGYLLVTKRSKPSILLGTVVFAAVFPLAAVAGMAYGQWKQEAVFKFAFIPPTDGGQININIVGPPDASLAATEEIVKKVEAVALKHPETEYVVANVGTQGGGFSSSSSGTQYAQVAVTLREKASLVDNLLPFLHKGPPLRKVRDTSVIADLTRDIGHVPGATISLASGGGFGFGAAIQLAFKGENRDQLIATAIKVRDGLQSGAIKGVITPDVSSKPGKQELRAVPNRARMAEANLSAAEVGAALRMLYEGDDSIKFRERGTEYPIRVMMDTSDRDDPHALETLPIAFRSSNPIYLSEVASREEGRGVDKITRRDRQETITVTAELLPGYAAGSVQAEIDAWLKAKNMVPDGVSYRPLGQADTQSREMGYLFGALGLGLILVYMILASLFDNLLYPFIIQLAQPQAMIGALLALVLTDKTLNIVGMIGIIALVGLVGKNAILLVDYTNTLRDRGEDRELALVESGGTRLRPIMMTTLALLFGMLPVALALGRGSEFRETIGITIIGGTLLSTVLTLLVIPCSYSIFDDMVTNLGQFLNRLTKRGQNRSDLALEPHGETDGQEDVAERDKAEN